VERIALNIPTRRPFTKRPLLATERPEAMLTAATGEALMGHGLEDSLEARGLALTHAISTRLSQGLGESASLSSSYEIAPMCGEV